MNTAVRTFDCPWCGAISTVPLEHLGEHYDCPECHKPTKITAKNTMAGDILDAPVDLSHLSGDRTFDCPWCGAISAVPASHLGERFVCPECHKDTKLTPTNTQRAPVTVPPPDAPHVESSRRGLWIGLVVVVAAFAAWLLLRPAETSPESPEPERTARAPGVPAAPAEAREPRATATPAVAPPATPTPTATEAPPMPTPGPREAPPPMPSPRPREAMPTPAPGRTTEAPPPTPGGTVAPPAESPLLVRARAKRDAASAALAAATEKHARAQAALETWAREHPGALEAARDLPALEQTSAELVRLLSDPGVVADPAHPKPSELHAVREAMSKFVAASPPRVALAQRALTDLRHDLGGREVAGVSDWRDLDFAGPGFRRVTTRFLEAARAVAVPAELASAHASATKELDAARVALESAEADLKAAQGGPR